MGGQRSAFHLRFGQASRQRPHAQQAQPAEGVRTAGKADWFAEDSQADRALEVRLEGLKIVGRGPPLRCGDGVATIHALRTQNEFKKFKHVQSPDA